jgi:hypothetical protein
MSSTQIAELILMLKTCRIPVGRRLIRALRCGELLRANYYARYSMNRRALSAMRYWGVN